jgi:arsenate reductase (thioredoxin)
MSRRKQVLFVCIGNACRSQMAEAFANRYGEDVLTAVSAGLDPADMVAPSTARLMFEKGISLAACRPKGLDEIDTGPDLIVNMSGLPMPAGIGVPVREWKVEDPIWVSEQRHREVRDQIETLVQGLINEFRRQELRSRRTPPPI